MTPTSSTDLGCRPGRHHEPVGLACRCRHQPRGEPRRGRRHRLCCNSGDRDGTVPAAALWWDGFTIAKNISDEDAAASFQAMVHAISPETIAAHPDAATWLVEGYTPGAAAVGVIANATGGAKAYPMQPYMGLLHTALFCGTR